MKHSSDSSKPSNFAGTDENASVGKGGPKPAQMQNDKMNPDDKMTGSMPKSVKNPGG